MRGHLAFAALITSSACALGPTDLTEVRTLGPTTFSGYTQAPGDVVRVRAFQVSTQQWVTIAQATSGAAPAVPANAWGGNPALYEWSVTAPIATAADPQGHCFLNGQCAAPTGTSGHWTVRIMFEIGSVSAPVRATVYDALGMECLSRRVQAGQAFDAAAYDCRSPTYPEIRLRMSRWWPTLPPGPPAGPPVAARSWDPVIVATDGATVRYTRHDTSGEWAAWRAAPGAAPVPFVANEPPLLMPLEIYAVGQDGRVYRATSSDFGSPIAAVSGITRARGHLSAATAPFMNLPAARWLGYMGTDGVPRVAVLSAMTVLREVEFVGDDLVLAPDAEPGAGTPALGLIAVVRQGGTLRFYRLLSDHPPQLFGQVAAGAIGRLSNPVASHGALHFLYATATSLVHASLPLRGGSTSTTRTVHTWASGAPVDASPLALIDTNLITAWIEPTGLAIARWAPGGAAGTWIEDRMEDSTALVGPIALLERPVDVDVLARTPDGALHLQSATAFLRRRQVERELDIFTTSASSGCGSAPNVPDPAWQRDVLASPRIAELGQALWRLPVGFTEPLLRDLGYRSCVAGAVQPATIGRACELAKTNVIFSPTPAAYTCADGLYVRGTNPGSDHVQQLGRALSRALGIDDAGSTPDASHAAASGLPLAVLLEARTLFTLPQPIPCPGGNCLGMVVGSPFEGMGPEEGFAQALFSYVEDGKSFRERAESQRSLVPCSDRLWRKYEWIRTHVYHGAEFRKVGDTSPSPSFCAP